MRSLRSTLSAVMLGLGALILLGALTAVHTLASGLLERQFDRGLLERATSLATLLEQVGEHFELHFSDEAMPRYAVHERPEYFQLWSGARELERSVSLVLAQAELPRTADAEPGVELAELELPDGRAGRMVTLTTPVHHYAPDPASGADPGPMLVSVVVAIERRELREMQESLLLGVFGLGLVLLSLLVFLGTRALTLGLRPLARLADELALLEREEGPADGLARLELPVELAPVTQRIGSLTASLQAALARERRATAGMAHELRTPVAELRAVSDVALQSPDDIAGLRQAVSECRDIALGMQTLITTLLALARSRAPEPLVQEQVDLAELVDRLWHSLDGRARERGLEWTLVTGIALPPVVVNLQALRAVLGNLFDNACDHARRGTRSECRLESGAFGTRVVVRNVVEGLRPEELAQLGEPFWRADQARADREHFGLGLALARECAAAAGFELDFQLAEGRLVATVTLPHAARPISTRQ